VFFCNDEDSGAGEKKFRRGKQCAGGDSDDFLFMAFSFLNHKSGMHQEAGGSATVYATARIIFLIFSDPHPP